MFQCSSDCGEGTRERTVTCTNPQGLCDPLSQPTLKEPCEDHSRCYEWKTGDWSKVADSFQFNHLFGLFSYRVKNTRCKPAFTDTSTGVAVLFILWERPSVTSGPVHAQGDWSPWQRVPGDIQTPDLPTLSPRHLQ